jgi:hypothetical protein
MEQGEVFVKEASVEVATFSDGTIIKRQRPETANNSNRTILPLFNRPMDGQTFIQVFKKGVTEAQIVELLQDSDFDWTSDGQVVHPAPQGAATFESKCQQAVKLPAGTVIVKQGHFVFSGIPDGEYKIFKTMNRQSQQIYSVEIQFV